MVTDDGKTASRTDARTSHTRERAHSQMHMHAPGNERKYQSIRGKTGKAGRRKRKGIARERGEKKRDGPRSGDATFSSKERACPHSCVHLSGRHLTWESAGCASGGAWARGRRDTLKEEGMVFGLAQQCPRAYPQRKRGKKKNENALRKSKHGGLETQVPGNEFIIQLSPSSELL